MALNKKNLLVNFFLILFSLAISIVFAEIVCRIFPQSNDSDPTYKLPHEQLSYLMKPNTESVSIHGHSIKINSHGLRDFEYPYKKEDEVFRILALGDSVTFSYGIDMEEGYTKVLEKRLNDLQNKKYKKIEVINTAHVGFKLHDEYNYLNLFGLKYSPDLIVVGINSNHLQGVSLSRIIIKDGMDYTPDSVMLSFPTWVKKTLRGSHLYFAIGWWAREIRYKMRSPSNSKLGGASKEILSTTQEHFEKIISLASKNTMPVLFLMLPSKIESIGKDYGGPEFYQLVKNLGKDSKAVVVDMMKPFAESMSKGDDLYEFKDPSHPNPKGHEILANGLFEKIAPYIQ
jgi:lysophospholipase L1-like esterase